ncbi:MAG: hypothetical protein QQN63_12670, partial [Nitrosopumilus sp.]
LFEQGQVTPIAHTAIELEMHKYLDDDRSLWYEVLGEFNFTPSAPTRDPERDEKALKEGRMLAILLYYISPWLLRWRGTQLPVELIIGEPGSGKSSLYELRQTIVTGYPRLSNMTLDINDWYAGITSRGGIHVLDNIHFTSASKDYQQRLSDELCRLVTEPSPHVEMRKLYTNSEVLSLPVSCTFALTALEQPFYTTDLIQRSAIFELEVIQKGHDAAWVRNQINRGEGRIGWVGHQLAALHKFLHLAVAKGRWNDEYRAGHRLANYEQVLMIMAEALGMEYDWIPGALKNQTATKLSETDWAMAGLEEFVNWVKEQHPDDFVKQRFGSGDIGDWADLHDNYCKNPTLTNPWRLGKYLRTHRGSIQKVLRMYENGTMNNKRVYSIEGD